MRRQPAVAHRGDPGNNNKNKQTFSFHAPPFNIPQTLWQKAAKLAGHRGMLLAFRQTGRE
ncbi:hypothetical protein FJMB80055_32130 [Enterobacter hormaechei]|nr:hypothetical protein FJMB80055_32130 [Enterobacter hormaechei]GKW81191.1 hypothetical protein FJMB80015_27310 [Enterobacter hormaechei]